ncbi:MAG: hypothetical protein J5903_00590, partial [Clostridia bacterium]|nr:hypothetical protein [Clostridia bacterium]
ALFLANFKKVYDELVAHGYAPVVKGFAWMQGCNDLGFHVEYEDILKAFISDMRQDLAEITGDSSLNAMPFVIGKIATSFGRYDHPYVPAFNEMQQKVADDMGTGVETVETSDLIIVKPDGTYNGTDQYHFNCRDMETLGIRFGEKLLELNGRSIVSVSKQNGGNLSYAISNDGKVVFTVSPESDGVKKYKMSKLFVNDVDVTADVVNGVYTVENPDSRTYARAEFVEKDKYSVTYIADDKIVGVVNGMRSVYENEDLSFGFGVKQGYEITEVKANGVVVLPEEDGNNRYVVRNVTGNVRIEVSHRAINSADETEEQTNEKTEIKDPKTTVIVCVAVGAGVVVVGAGVAVVFIIKKRKIKKG